MPHSHVRNGERRRYVRIVYPRGLQARIAIGERHFEIADITQSGVRLRVPASEPLPATADARLHLIGGATLSVTAHLEWREGDQAGFSLQELIPAEVIENEQRRTILGTP